MPSRPSPSSRAAFTTYRSPGTFKNYCFMVRDLGTGAQHIVTHDGVREARYYFAQTVTGDNIVPTATNPEPAPQDPGQGKTEIRIHRGSQNMASTGSGFAGCLVSPLFFELRRVSIERFQDDSPTGINHEVQKAAVVTEAATNALYKGTGAQGLTSANWDNEIFGDLWLVRPDERPLG